MVGQHGAVDQTQMRSTVNEMPSVLWMLGNKYGSSDVKHQLVGTMKAVRAYNRVLSNAEIYRNYKVDVARFDGALAVTNVLVAGKFDEYQGTELGAYEVVGTGTFTAGDATDHVKGKVRPILGYTIEEWNGDSWGDPVEYEGSSYTYTFGESSAMVCLTWLWEPDGTMIILH